MPLLFSEEFETSTGTAPSGWTLVINTATVTSSGYHNHGCALSGGCQIRHSLPSHITAGSLFYVVQGQSTLFQAQQLVITGTGTGTISSFQKIAEAVFGDDHTLVVRDGSGAVICFGESQSSLMGEQNPAWTFIQLDLTLSAATIGTNSAMSVACTARVNGEAIANGTNTFATSLTAYYDNLFFQEFSGGLGLLDSIYQYDAILASPIVTPNNGTPKARISQAVIENLRLQSDADGRISQALIEHIQLPTSAAARVSQAVIELITVGGSGWSVYEA